MAIDIGLINYNEYRQSMMEKGKAPPAWEDIGEEQRAWRNAACAVLKYMEQCKEEMENNSDKIG
jgi:hypothetical protein